MSVLIIFFGLLVSPFIVAGRYSSFKEIMWAALLALIFDIVRGVVGLWTQIYNGMAYYRKTKEVKPYKNCSYWSISMYATLVSLLIIPALIMDITFGRYMMNVVDYIGILILISICDAIYQGIKIICLSKQFTEKENNIFDLDWLNSK